MKNQSRLLTILSTTTVLVALLFSSTSFAGDKHFNNKHHWAKVTQVEPITRTVERREPYQNCWTESVRYDEHDDDRSYTGTILGGIIGGAVGNAVGHKKKNKKIGTAVGALLGASIGNDISYRHRDRSGPRYREERRCETNHEVSYEEEVVGYHVWYRYHGEEYKTRMNHKPGKKIKVRVSVEPV